ncbi:MAG TPA: hypothetical protein VHX16_00395 [Chloroflexota bacterium]|nr:hypothetical protein [Chloroflexota bacterium]
MGPPDRLVPGGKRVTIAWACGLLALGILLAWMLPTTASAQSGPAVSMQIRAGFDGLGKVGGWIPVEIELRNDGPDITGELQISVQDTTTNRGTYTRPPTIYSVPAVLPRKSHKRLTLDILLPSSAIRTQARLVEGTTTHLEQDVSLTRVAPGDLICGVLSRSSNTLDFLPSLELPAPLRRARVARIDVNDLPTRPQLLASLDCLILSNLSTQSMLDYQKAALATWVENGGLLVLAGGPSWQRTISALPPHLLPVKLTGLASIQRLDGMADFLNTELTDSGPWLASQATVEDGTVLVEEDGVPLLVSARRGAGVVFYMALDPAGEPLRSWPGSVGLWRYILSHVSGGVGLSAATSSPFSSWGRIPRNALVDVSTVPAPSPNGLVGILIVYLVLVGPGNYMLVRRYQQPMWTLVTVPTLTALAVIGSFAMSSANRDSDVVANQISLVRAGQSGELGHARTYVSVLARRPGWFDVSTNDASLISSLYFPFPRDPSMELASGGTKVLEGSQPSIVDMYLPAGSLGTASVDSLVQYQGPLESNLVASPGEISGTITNRLGQTLNDVTLVLDFQVTRIGDLAAGETRDISVPMGRTLSAGYGPPTSFASLLYPNVVKPKMVPSDTARRDVLDSLLGTGFNFNRLELPGLGLVGWLESSQIPVEVKGGRATNIDGALYVASLPIDLPKGFEGEIPAPIVAKRQLGANTASRQQYGSYDLSPGESLALQFSLPMANGRMLLDRLYLNVDGRFRGGNPAATAIGDVSLFNWHTSEWEDWSVSYGVNEFLDPTRFVSGAGDVRIRYTFRPPADSRITGVSFTRFDVTALGLVR